MSATVNEKILNALNMYNEGLQEKISEHYVEKDGNKVLSTNDFTTAEKEKLGGLSNFDPSTLSDTYVTKSTIAGLSSVYVEKDGDKVLSSNDFTDDYKFAVDGLSSTYVQKDGNKVLSTNDFTNDYKFAIDGLSSTYAKKSEVASVLKYQGTVLNFSAIPSDTSVGDVWNISVGGGVDENGIAIKDGDNVAKTPTGFDVLAGSIDLSGYVEKDGAKVLSTNDFTNDYKAAIDGLSSMSIDFDPETLSDTYVLQVAGKVLSSNDFTDADKTKLDNLPAISLFMKALLETNNAIEARSLLKVGREDIFDETGGRWNSLSACPDTSIKKFGTKSLHTLGNGYLIKPTGLTLGGKNFAIAFWAYAPSASTSAQALFSLGTNKNSIKIFRDNSNKLTTSCVENGSFTFSTASGSAERVTFTTAQWNHVELDFNYSSGTIYLFLNGSLVCSTTACTLFSTAQAFPIYIGYDIYNASYYFNGYIDEFLITERLLHTSTFTPPTAPYALDSDTLALLHFDQLEIISDDAGFAWNNYSAEFSSTQKKFGTKALYISDSFLQSTNAVTLSGEDFAIAGQFYLSSSSSSTVFLFGWGDSSTRLVVGIQGSSGKLFWNFYYNGTLKIALANMASTPLPSTNTWYHVEIDYRNSDNKAFLFFDGVKVDEQTLTDFSSTLTLPFYIATNPANTSATFKGYIDEFLITKTLLHDDDFTPPTAPYDPDSDTLALLHFE